MKQRNFFIPILIVFALIVSGCGRKKSDGDDPVAAPKQVTVPQAVAEEEPEEDAAPAIIFYIVKLSGKTLSLYEQNGEAKKLITSIEITPEAYPESDIKKLENGIEAYCMEDGYEILENFAN